MMKRKKILFIGSVNNGLKPKGGDQAKNQILLKKLKADLGDDVYNFDVRKHKFTPYLAVLLLFNILAYDRIVISVNSSGLKTLGFINFILKKKKTTIFLIGGIVHKRMASKQIRSVLESACIVYAETRELVRNIKSVSEKVNVSYLPNFKIIPDGLKIAEKLPGREVKLVFLSRVREDKGIFDCIDIVNRLNSSDPETNYTLSIYGSLQLTDEEKVRFDKSLEDSRIRYEGFLDFNLKESYEILGSHHFMLFLTRFIGEGFPGVIVDAMIAQLPVIASDFRYNSEILEDEDGIMGSVLKMDSDWVRKASELIIDYKNNPSLYKDTVRRMAASALRYDASHIRFKIC